MRAILLSETGGPERLKPGELPEPEPGEGQALVRIRAAGVNFLDLLVRSGNYPQSPPLPLVPGVEIAGEVDGRRVIAMLPASGGYAEAAAVDEHRLYPLPDGASFEEGASFLLTYLTAYIPLTRQVRVRSGATILVYAGAGGVGTATIQVARALGARVVAAVGSEEKLGVCRELGAEEAYVYADIPDDLRADVIVDPVGGELFAGSFARLKPLGAVVAIGSAAGAWSEIEPARLVGRNVGLYGFYLGRLLRLEPEVVGTAVGELLGLWQTGALRPFVGAELPLDEVEQAHELVESRRSVGKVVLRP